MEQQMAKNIKRAKLVKEARLERAWSQSQLATIADVNLRTIQRVEKDGTASLETLRGLAQAFEIDVKELDPAPGANKTTDGAKAQRNVHLLPRLASGKSLSEVVLGSDRFQVEHDDDHDKRSIAAMKDILELLKRDVVRLYDADPVERLNVEAELSQELKGLEAYGYYLFGIRREIPELSGKMRKQTAICTLYMSHARSPKIVRDRNLSMFIPALLPEVVKVN